MAFSPCASADQHGDHGFVSFETSISKGCSIPGVDIGAIVQEIGDQMYVPSADRSVQSLSREEALVSSMLSEILDLPWVTHCPYLRQSETTARGTGLA